MEDEKNSEAQGWEVDGRRMSQGRRDPLPECFTCPTLPGLPLPGGKELDPATTQWRGDLSVSVRISSQIGRVGVRVFGLSSSRHCHQNHLISNIRISGDIHAAFVCLLFLLGGTAGISSTSSHSFPPGVLMNWEACGV